MANVLVEESTLKAIGDSIRGKTGASDTYLPSEMPAAINSITTGGGASGDVKPFLAMPYRCDYLFTYNRLKTTFEPYKDELDWSRAVHLQNMFYQCSGDWTDWRIEISNAMGWNIFNYAKGIKFPHLKITSYESNGALEIFRDSCGPDRAGDLTVHNVELAPITPGRSARGFMEYSGLRFVPNSLYTFVGHNDTYTGTLSSSQTNPYEYMFYGAHAVEEILNVPLWTATTMSSNSSMLGDNYRLRRFTFETQPNGTPYSCPNWQNISLNFTKCYGYTPSYSGNGWGQGFTGAKLIRDADTYASLKNDPERCTEMAEYSDYGHNSAVETIKSLPYVKSGTVRLLGKSGSLTDQGACSNLTDSEIAIATSKGWTVAIS